MRCPAALNPPMVASVLAFAVGLTPPLQALFFGPDAPLALVVTSALEGFGQCAIPCILLVMGAQVPVAPPPSRVGASSVPQVR